jgi:hypothetical protein
MTADPVALALLRRVAELRPAGDPLHAFAATVLSGEATLRAAAGHATFAAAFTAALHEDDARGAAFMTALREADAHRDALMAALRGFDASREGCAAAPREVDAPPDGGRLPL